MGGLPGTDCKLWQWQHVFGQPVQGYDGQLQCTSQLHPGLSQAMALERQHETLNKQNQVLQITSHSQSIPGPK